MSSMAATIWICTLALLIKNTSGAYFEPNIPEDGKLNFTQLCEKYYKPCESYHVITEDGYIITVFRLNGGNASALPVLLWHDLFGSSDAFVERADNSTGIALARAGYDVWFGNSRSNKYSRQHIQNGLETGYKYWDFRFDEIGYYDLPAVIDFILEVTVHKKVSIIGHSEGSSAFLILGSQRPEYNDKIRIAIAMAPIAYLNHLMGLLAVLAPFWPAISRRYAEAGDSDILANQSSTHKLLELICSQGEFGVELCEDDILMGIAGDDLEQLGPEFFRVMLGHYPAGSSRKNVDHYYQVVAGRRFARFNYGFWKNLAKYGSPIPPNYDLAKVTMSIAILAAENDNISTLEDVDQLKKDLGNVVYYKVMDRKQFNHIDFVVANDINALVNPLLHYLLEKFGYQF